MPIIDNRQKTMLESLKNALSTSDRLDVQVGYFFLSGFERLESELKDKEVRVLVGLEIEPDLVPLISQYEHDPNLCRFQPRRKTIGALERKSKYIDALINFINESDSFDPQDVLERLSLFLSKIEDGSLSIRQTIDDQHGKFYLVHNRPEFNHGGDYPGTVFIGSSNFTYRGLVGQGELNESLRDSQQFGEYKAKFEEMWSSSKSIEIADGGSSKTFVEEIKKRVWAFQTPKPYEIYIRVLDELFDVGEKTDILTPYSITKGRYWDLEYQLDAIRLGIDRVSNFGGAILADVAGLGKSVIASAIARNLDMSTVIICPPHMIEEWEEYKEAFGIRGSKVFSSGKIIEVFNRYRITESPILIILDEAHRYRNEDNEDYKMLHQICRGHPENKVLVITATPFNNAPKDVFALVRLFQTPGRATIRSVEQLGLRFRELIQRYINLRKDMIKGKGKLEIDAEAKAIATEQRLLIEPVVIRRSRLDLKNIFRYRKDLETQGVDFATVIGPELIDYQLGDLLDLYLTTLESISSSTTNAGFIGARYRTAIYISDVDKFDKHFGPDVEISSLKVAQDNLSSFMRRLLVTRFESSREAFRKTLDSMIKTNEVVERWWTETGLVPIMKKGQIPDPDDFDDEDNAGGLDIASFEKEIEALKESKGLIAIPVALMKPEFLSDLRHDTKLLKRIYLDWFGSELPAMNDPKIDELEHQIKKLIQQNPLRKIVMFSMYADTVRYVNEELLKRGFDRVLSYTASEATKNARKVVKENFDASIRQEDQKDEFDILITTDALSEGINLHRAGIIINFDIPYNPTRVVQRIGRINRIDRRVFDEISIFNFFPSAVGEAEIRVKQISTLKIQLINAIMGGDHKALTTDEKIESFFVDEFNRADKENETLSWDAEHREALDLARLDDDLMERVHKIPHRSRVGRGSTGHQGVVVFGKKGPSTIFSFKHNGQDSALVGSEIALPMFAAKPDDLGESVSAQFADEFAQVRSRLFAKDKLSPVKGRRQKSVEILSALAEQLPESSSYCRDLVTVIKDYDDVSEGTLKDISQANRTDLEQLYRWLMELIPPSFIKNVFERAKLVDEGTQVLLFAEEHL